MDMRDDDVCAQCVAMFALIFPRPGINHRMPMIRGSMWVICSTVVHEGGGLPLAAEPGSRRIIGFCGLWTHTVSYATSYAISPPLWVHKAVVSCGVLGCRPKPASEKCFGCGVQVLCNNHTGMKCSKCDTEAAAAAATCGPRSAEAADPSRVLALWYMVTCLIPSEGQRFTSGTTRQWLHRMSLPLTQPPSRRTAQWRGMHTRASGCPGRDLITMPCWLRCVGAFSW